MGHFLLFPAPYGGGICRFVHAKLISNYIPGWGGEVTVYFDWCIKERKRKTERTVCNFISEAVHKVFS